MLDPMIRSQIEEIIIEEMSPLTQQIEALTQQVAAQQAQIQAMMSSAEVQSVRHENDRIVLNLRAPLPPALIALD